MKTIGCNFDMRVFSLLVCLVCIVGCGSGEDLPETGEVTGTVTLNGAPIGGGTVTFHPQGGTGNPAFGDVNADGTYSLTTYSKDDGAVLGEHVVTVELFPGQWAEGESDEAGLPGAESNASTARSIPGKYASPDSSPLKFTVAAGSNAADLALED